MCLQIILRKKGVSMRQRADFGLMKRKVNNHVVYYYWVYGPDEKRLYRSTGERTKAKAMEYVLRLRDEGSLGVIDRCKITLGEYAKNFFVVGKCPIAKGAEMRGRPISENTLKTWRTNLVKHILPHLGKNPLSTISKAVVNKWLLELPEKDGIGRSTSNTTLTALRQVMTQAERDGLIKTNPCDKADRLGDDSERTDAFTLEEVKKVIGTAEEWKNPMIRTMCMIAALTGMRIGEVRALKPEALSDTAIHVMGSYSDTGGYGPTKSKKDRVVPIPKFLRDELRFYERSDGGYLFRMYNDDKPVSYNWINKTLAKRCDKLKISGKTFHSFRTFVDTQLMAANVNETVVRAVIGHQNADMTEHYLHLEAGEFTQIRNVQDTIAENFA